MTKKRNQPEFEIYKSLAQQLRWLQKKYQFEWEFDTGSGIKLTMPQAMRIKSIQGAFKILDLRVYSNGQTLMLEIKAKSPFKKNGELLKSEHLKQQQKSIDRYKELGFEAKFSVGVDETMNNIINFLNNQNAKKIHS